MSEHIVLHRGALITCSHQIGLVGIIHTQPWVTIEGVEVLVEPDPEQRPIVGCPNFTVITKPCTLTLKAQRGYSNLITIDGRRVVRDDLKGLTDGQGGVFSYECRNTRHTTVVEVVA